MANTVSAMLSDETLNRIIQIESAGKPNAKAPTSSAAGLGQFITGTWLATVRKHKPGLLTGDNGPEVAAMRVGPNTVALQLEMLARFTEDNARALGAGFTDGDLYLAHFLGLGDARKLFRASPDTPAASVVSPGAVSANRSILAGKTCGQVRAWAMESMRSRWDRAGRPDWVKRYAGGPVAAPQTPAPTKPASTASDVGKVAGGGAIVATGAAGTHWGWGATEWIIAALVLAALGAAAYFGWRWWKARQERAATIREAGLAAVAEELEDTGPAGIDLTADALAQEIANKAKGSLACQAAADEMTKPATRRKRTKRKATPAKRAKAKSKKRRAK
jgi:hypothetical protein